MSAVREIMESVDCSKCGAKAGQHCTKPSGARAYEPHGARFDLATARGLLPLATATATERK